MPIHTDSEGLDTSDVQVPAADRAIPAYLAKPAASSTPLATVLVVQEIFGVNDHIRDVCRRFAKLGYLAIAPDLYIRQGDVSKMQDFREVVAQVVSKVPDAQVISDLDAAATLAARQGGDASRLALTGFCWGGRIAWLYAAHNAALKASAAWYGRLEGERTPLQPRHPIDVAADLRCPVLGLYGAQDQSIPLDSVERMKAALAAARKQSEIVVYPDAGHAFHADYRPTYHEPSARDGWNRTVAWFQRYLA